MWNKENFNKEIHLIAIEEGVGHITRIVYLAKFLNKFYKKIRVFIYQPEQKNLSKRIKNYLKTILKDTNLNYSLWSEKKIKNILSPDIEYILILDIRDLNPNLLIKFYNFPKVLCLDNYYKNKIQNVNYFYCLPAKASKKNIKELLKNFLLNPEFSLENKNQKNKEYILLYAGIQKSKIQKEKEIIRTIVQKFNLEDKKIIILNPSLFFNFKKFIDLFNRTQIIITYPGLLLYESILLEKEIIVYTIQSKVHNKILNQIKKDCQQYFKLEFKIRNIKFLYFDFKNFRKEIQYDKWNPYKNIMEWVKK